MELTALLERVAALPTEQRRAALRKLIERGVDLRALTPPRRGATAITPLSPQQEDLWTYEALYPGSALNLCGAYWFAESVDVDVLAASLNELVARHPVLHSRFTATENGLEQQAEPRTLRLVRIDVGAEAGRVRPLIQEHARTPFDLADGLPVRALLITGPAIEHGVLVLAFHHIVTDWWTFDLLHQELSVIYAARSAGREPVLAEVPDYGDFAAWHQDLRVLDVWQDDERFWARYLADPPEPPFPAVAASATANRIDVDFGFEALDGLTEFARAHGLSLFVAGFSVFALFLHQQTGTTDVVVGTPAANRDQPGTAELIGYVMNMVPVRVSVTSDGTLAGTAASIAESAAEALAHGKLPLGRITSVANLARQQGHAPAYQVVYMYLPEQQSITTLPGAARFERVHTGDEENDFVVILRESAGRLTGTFEFRSDLLDVETVRCWTNSFANLLSGLLADPLLPVSEVDTLTSAERARVLELGAGAETGIQEIALHELLSGHDRNALALVHDDEALTYGELDERSARLASALRGRGVEPGSRVGLRMERSIAQFVALVAVLRTGAAYVPMDPAYPADRLDFMVSDSGVSLVLDDAGLTDYGRLEQSDSDRVAPGSPAYLIYTSGSTGVPKGVLATHRGAVNLATAQARSWGLTPADRVLQFASLSFDASVEEVWTTWASGACLVLKSAVAETSASAFVRFVADAGITVLDLPTAFWGMLSTEPGAVLPPSVHTVVIGGEAYSGAALAAWRAKHPGVRLINTYGPTESTVTATAVVLDSDAVHSQVIGRPLDNVRVRVLDETGRPVGIGVPGELYVGGAGVAIGYLDRPELTEERFVERFGERLYRTGDLVRMRPDGALVFLGRGDDQVKLRGFRVELGEVENALAAHPDVLRAVAVVDGTGEDARLIAHVVSDAGAVPDGIRGWLAGRVPAHLVPAIFLPLEEVPLGPSGKVNRRALPAPGGQRTAAGTYVEPRTDVELELASIWAEVLGVTRVSVHDDFFVLGGTSLQAIRATGELERRTGFALPFAEVFSHPTVAGMAALAAGSAPAEVIMPRKGTTGDWPLSAAQAGLWYLSQLEEVGTSYSIVEAMLAGPGVDPARLADCLRILVARHEALRTTFAWSKTIPVQRVHESLVPESHQLTGVSIEDLPGLVDEQANNAFDLEKGPLVRLLTAQLVDGRWGLVLSVHHIVADGLSLGLLFGELAELYAGNELAAAPLQLADHAVWQRGRAGSPGLDFWTDRLRGAPELLELPWDRPRPPRQHGVGGTVRRRLAPDVVAGVEDLARRQRVTSFSVFLSAYQVLLSRLAGQQDVVVGLPVSGRTRPELERVVGFFVNTVPLRIDVSAGIDFLGLTTRVGSAVAEALRHQDVPLDQIVSALSPRRSPSHHPLFQVVFSWNELGEPLVFGGESVSPLPVELPVAKFDLGLALRPDGEGGLEAAFEFRTDLLDRDTVERWAESYAVLLAELVAEPARAVASAPMHTPARADEVLALGVGRRIDGTVATAHGLVERAARLTPDAPALVVEDQELSYAELNHRADRLAARLRGAGVRPGVRVGIRLDRSVELYVAVLGVLKAGGAYVPLDPEYPQQRLDFMVADSGVALVLDEAELDPVGPAVETDAVAPDAIAYVCYTSGSTGKPKGVLVPHSGVSNLAAMQHEDFGMCADDRVLQFASLSFDASVFEMFMTWAAGACLVAVRADRRTGALLQSTLDDHEITVATLPPSIIGQLDPDANPGLRVLITAGEPCPRWLVNRWGQGRRLINAYGPTEATVCATAADLAPGDRLVVGKPIGNVRVHVLDEAQQVVPIGVVGEVYIGGAGIARGYLNRPELTAERFVSGLYRTGDLGRLCADGSLELLGRIDDQVKVHGFRIELGEVESAVAAHPEVVQAVATVSAGRLVAHVRTADGTVPTGLRGWLAQRAPAHLVPAVFQPIGEIPLSPTGKVDRRALPEPDMSRPELDIEYVAPRTGLERRLAELWSEVLNVSRIGVRDNFFDLGGDSLLLVALAARLESDGLPGSLVSLYLHQTIEELGDDLLTSGVSDD